MSLTPEDKDRPIISIYLPVLLIGGLLTAVGVSVYFVLYGLFALGFDPGSPDPDSPDSSANEDDAVWLDLVARLEGRDQGANPGTAETRTAGRTWSGRRRCGGGSNRPVRCGCPASSRR